MNLEERSLQNLENAKCTLEVFAQILYTHLCLFHLKIDLPKLICVPYSDGDLLCAELKYFPALTLGTKNPPDAKESLFGKCLLANIFPMLCNFVNGFDAKQVQ